ncbi:7TM domain sensor diguanylate cyclase [Methylophaga lonarensis MPL]|uniref:diguanylate cyclase n=1 Tax=Methylophaga lonarensis MPL TaxID=1286106 RepID=M7NXI5_9GAMM|nr:diguanylate cyclase [Methylophaga lonarensis]EMR11987.1 7TM domain sensor diguanylate cyclase [Methylophaga lonarensis MPL]
MRYSQLITANLRTWTLNLVCLLLIVFPAVGFAQQEFVGQWYQVGSDWQFPEQPSEAIAAPKLTGGRFVFQTSFEIRYASENIVIDFKNASSLGRFQHTITDAQGNIVAVAKGGIQSETTNEFFLRHGREFSLPPGQYQLTTELTSPYFIAEPQPYLDTLSNYRQAIKWGNFITLVSLGVLISLGVYYAILALVRRRTTEIMYTFFIWMNVLYNSTALLLTPDLFNIHWFYFVGGPILLSNFAYVLFAKHLLQITAETHPLLDRLATLFLVLMAGLLLAALFNHHWVIESARYGVGLMMLYGLIAALVRAYEGYEIAYYYLVAIAAFFIIGSFAISSKDLEGIYTLYIEHIGLLAVTVEVLLIGLVLGYQFAEVYRDKEKNLALVRHSLQIAHHDALTGLPNRYAMDQALEKMSSNGMITLLDMDNLKLYNDTFGHSKGDELLQLFASTLSTRLGGLGVLHRMGGDEFAILSDSSNLADSIRQSIDDTIKHLHRNGFDKAGVSYGLASMSEVSNVDELRMLADQRMYQHKRNTNMPQWA